MFIFMVIQHMNHHVWLYGVYWIECVYIPYSQVVDHSPVVSGHDVNTAFDYSTNYFYFDQAKNAYLTFNNVYFEYLSIMIWYWVLPWLTNTLYMIMYLLMPLGIGHLQDQTIFINGMKLIEKINLQLTISYRNMIIIWINKTRGISIIVIPFWVRLRSNCDT